MRRHVFFLMALLVSFVSLGRYADAGEPLRLTISAYASRHVRTASGQVPGPGMIAVSRDLRAQGWTFGRRVVIKDLGEFLITDLMHKRRRKSLDILLPSKAKARRFGRRTCEAALKEPTAASFAPRVVAQAEP